MSREGRGLKWCVKKPRTAEDCQHTTGSREKSMEQILPYSSQRSQPRQCLDFGLPASNTVRHQVAQFMVLCYGSQRRLIPTSIKAGGLGFQSLSLRSGTVPYLTLDPQASYSIWKVKVTLQKSTRASLVVQWLANLPSNASMQVQTLVWKVRSHMPQLRPAAAKNK